MPIIKDISMEILFKEIMLRFPTQMQLLESTEEVKKQMRKVEMLREMIQKLEESYNGLLQIVTAITNMDKVEKMEMKE